MMIKSISEIAQSDAALREALGKAREYAEIYLMTKKRQRGCDGMGELATVKEEFRDVIDKMLFHCRERKYIFADTIWDIDLVAEEIDRL